MRTTLDPTLSPENSSPHPFRRLRSPPLAALVALLLPVVLAGAACVTGGDGAEDDGVTPGDDDSNEEDCDEDNCDDSESDDCECEDDEDEWVDPDAVQFAFNLRVTPPDEPADARGGDDDDSGGPGDDDDSAGSGGDDDSAHPGDDDSAEPGDDDDVAPPASLAEMELIVVYVADADADIPLCEQHLSVLGSAWFGFGVIPDACDNCTGFIEFHLDTLADISDPLANDDHCDPTVLDANQYNYGLAMFASAADGGLEAFGKLGFIDQDTAEALNLALDASGDTTLAGLDADLSDYGVDATHIVYVDAPPDSPLDAAGLGAVGASAGEGSTYLGFFWLGRNVDGGGVAGMTLSGDYFGQAFVQFGGG